MQLGKDQLQDIDNPGAHPDYGAKAPVDEGRHDEHSQDNPGGGFADNHCSSSQNLPMVWSR